MEEFGNVLKTFIPSYTNADINQIVFSRLFSGTNIIYKAQCSDAENVIIRKFGSNSLVSREIEKRNFHVVSSSNLGPKCLYETEEYRIEQYIHGETLRRDQLERLAESVAPCLVSFHNIARGSGISSTESYIHNWKSQFISQVSECNSITYLEKEMISSILATISSEEGRVLSLLPNTEDLIFSHNDFSYGNIIYDNTKYWIIDYEYAGLGYPSIDLASYIIESMFDFSTPEYRYIPEDEISYNSQLGFVGAYAEEARLDADDLWNEVCRSKAVLCYLGALWAGCMYKPGDVNMLRYSLTRLELFNKYNQTNS
jgi:thiamine kinase-like enzyme